MKGRQRILGFDRKIIKYCTKCNMKYNTTNLKDIAFHNKVHRAALIPKCTRICDNLYQRGNVFYYGEGEVGAKCTVRWHNGHPTIKGLWFTTAEYKECMLDLLRGLYGVQWADDNL